MSAPSHCGSSATEVWVANVKAQCRHSVHIHRHERPQRLRDNAARSARHSARAQNSDRDMAKQHSAFTRGRQTQLAHSWAHAQPIRTEIHRARKHAQTRTHTETIAHKEANASRINARKRKTQDTNTHKEQRAPCHNRTHQQWEAGCMSREAYCATCGNSSITSAFSVRARFSLKASRAVL